MQSAPFRTHRGRCSGSCLALHPLWRVPAACHTGRELRTAFLKTCCSWHYRTISRFNIFEDRTQERVGLQSVLNTSNFDTQTPLWGQARAERGGPPTVTGGWQAAAQVESARPAASGSARC